MRRPKKRKGCRKRQGAHPVIKTLILGVSKQVSKELTVKLK